MTIRFPDAGRRALSRLLAPHLWLFLGAGLPSWDVSGNTRPEIAESATNLTTPQIITKPRVRFLEIDEMGTIAFAIGDNTYRYREDTSAEPEGVALLLASDLAEDSGLGSHTIREMGVFYNPDLVSRGITKATELNSLTFTEADYGAFFAGLVLPIRFDYQANNRSVATFLLPL